MVELFSFLNGGGSQPLIVTMFESCLIAFVVTSIELNYQGWKEEHLCFGFNVIQVS
jgi:hypothetical protein